MEANEVRNKAVDWLVNLLNEIGDSTVKFTPESKKNLIKDLKKYLK